MAPKQSDTLTLLEAAVTDLGGAPRPGQQAMAEAVAHACRTGKHVAVQAGTGTGKSLGYLVPAAQHAQETNTTVVVSTATIALQRQLVDRDLPRLSKALDNHLSRPLTYAIVKGRNNYVCLNKISAGDDGVDDALYSSADITWMGKQVKKVADWAKTTDRGDRDGLDFTVPDLVWKQVSVSAKECVGANLCPFGQDCFAEQAKARAQDVDIVVTNHALLAIDALSDGVVLPEHDVVIVDEAHELEGRMTTVATEELSAAALAIAANRAKSFGAGVVHERLLQAAEDVDQHLDELDEGRITHFSTSHVAMLQAAAAALEAVASATGNAPPGEKDNDPEKYAERHMLATQLGDLSHACERMIAVSEIDDPAAQQDVVWMSVHRDGSRNLKVAPLSVAGLVATTVLDNATTILTSATLTAGGSFLPAARAWGTSLEKLDTLDVGTPFTPETHGILYVAKHLPAPGRDGMTDEVLEEIYELIMAAGGRTLGLFSSRRAAEYAKDKLSKRLPFDIFVQGDDTTGALVDKFSKNENSCLFGTLSLWQGVDVPGSSLSHVLIDRIPFPRPDDPLLSARQQAATAAGRSGFMEVSVTHASILMAQGVGRLLRDVNDKGVVSVLDSRLVTKQYGGFIVNTLPNFWRTTDHDVAVAALKRLATQSRSK